ncbi:hypothetical protein EK21DRAFT_97835 [Setomelanomma holmii]|uniref:Feruloyl esterase C n=1 Tax=Setomelanomma holmii TaxID=210430 RepID=A0A9P4HF88_9PLEO|nr:hypothetical protein EK21DRAFT_97835 [Setomelanomma holmii]
MSRSSASQHVALLVLALFDSVQAGTAGCDKPSKLTSDVKTTIVTGEQRRWTLRIPINYNSTRPYRFIFGLYWLNDDMTSVDGGSAPYCGLKGLAQDSAIFVAPDGLQKGWTKNGGEDITFLNKMHFRAIAILSGATLSGCNGGNDPIALHQQHGVKESNNGCQAKNAPEPAKNSRQRITTVYDGCKYPTQWIAFDGDHVALPDASIKDAGQNNFMPAEVWSFFSQFE